MLIFIISFFIVFISSYFFASIIAPQKGVVGFIYLLILTFAQIVLTFELLSLFSAISQKGVLGLNAVFFAVAAHLWFKKQRPILYFGLSDFKNKLVNSLKLDKYLRWLFFGFCFFVLVSLFLCLVMPVNDPDAAAYHIARCYYWIQQGSLNHFDVSDVRNICLPINSEILYTWVILFLKKNILIGFFAFFGYLLSIVSIYNILGCCGYCTRKKLWVIFVLSSLPSVLVQASSTQTDLIIAGLITSSIFLFWYSLKNEEKVPVYMAALAYALAVGTKPTALMMAPGVAILLLTLCVSYKKYKPLACFIGFAVFNFLIFASYNYILNYLQFSNFMGAQSYIEVNKNHYGVRGAFATFIKHMFSFIDFTGFRWSFFLNPFIEHLKMFVLGLFGLANLPNAFDNPASFTRALLFEEYMGAGVLGFLIYLPCIIFAIFNFRIFKFGIKANLKKAIIPSVFGMIFVINFLVLSYLMSFSTFDMRYVVSFLILSSPVLIYSYFKKTNFVKVVIIIFSLFSYFIVATNISSRPFFGIINLLKKENSIESFRERVSCKSFDKNAYYKDTTCYLSDKIKKNISKQNKIAIFLNNGDGISFIKSLYFKGYDIDLKLLEDASSMDFSKYNIVIFKNYVQLSSLIKNTESKKYDYKVVDNQFVSSPSIDVPCFYQLNTSLLNPIGTKPCFIQCNVKERFMPKKRFKLISVYKYTDYFGGKPDYYYVYRNMLLPAKFN